MNDASQDATNHVTKKRKHDVVTHVFNLGYGSGLQLGYKYAVRKGYSYVIQMDADGQHDVCNLLEIYKELQKEDENGKLPDIVLGSRFMEGSSGFSVSFAKKIAFVWFRIMLKTGTGRRITDPTTGLQGIKTGEPSFFIRNIIILMTNIQMQICLCRCCFLGSGSEKFPQ